MIKNDKKTIMNKNLIVISGATAIGKTNLAIKLAKYFNTEIISADSRQFYRELRIGSAHPSDDELLTIKHHFIGNLSITENYNVGYYEKDVTELIDKLFNKYDIVIMVGGSGLYIDSICFGLDKFPEVNKLIKDELIEDYKTKGISFLQSELKECDYEYYKITDINNHQRLIRALSVIRVSGKKFSFIRNNQKTKRNFNISHFSLQMERSLLYKIINNRVEIMLKNGLIEEAEGLIKYRNNNALQTVGYSELFEYFDGKYNKEEAIMRIKQNTRRFAKRQISWFKNKEKIKYIDAENSFSKILTIFNR